MNYSNIFKVVATIYYNDVQLKIAYAAFKKRSNV